MNFETALVQDTDSCNAKHELADAMNFVRAFLHCIFVQCALVALVHVHSTS